MNGYNPQYPGFNGPQQPAPQTTWQQPQQPLPSTPRELGSPAPSGPHYAPYGQASAFATKPRSKGSLLAGALAVSLLAIGGGGAAGVATSLMLQDGASPASTRPGITQVVQANSSAPDWSATAAVVSPAVVAIKVSGPTGAGEGSGVILDGQGNIVTNNHVISGAGEGARILVVIGTEAHEAKVVGTDPSTDLAVIRLANPPRDLAAITFGDSNQLKVGDPVMAVGNPLGLSDTVTTGIVSALDRPVSTREVSPSAGDSGNGTVVTAAIQTSAAINPGNSGGALVNANAELVGITSSIATLTSNSSGQSGSIGIGFAIPSSQVRSVADQLIANGVAQHPQLGVSATDVKGSAQLGAEVAQVVTNSAANEAGLKVGDIITGMDGRPITSSEALVALVRSSEVGQKINLDVLRDGKATQVSATLRAAK